MFSNNNVLTHRSLTDGRQELLVFGIRVLERPFQIVKYLVDAAVVAARPADGVNETVQHLAVNILRLCNIKQQFLTLPIIPQKKSRH